MNLDFIVPFTLGLIICLYYPSVVFLYSFFKTPKGYKWVPVNDEHHAPGDSRMFAACVQSIRSRFFKYQFPIEKKRQPIPLDFFRVSSYRLAALLGFFLPDERWAYFLSFVSGILLNYVFVFFIGATIGLSYPYCLFLALLMVFCIGAVLSLFPPKRFLSYCINYIFNIRGRAFFDRVNDNFRYVVFNTANIFIWLSFFLFLKYDLLINNPAGIAFLVLFFIAAPFIYPPASLFIYLIVAGVVGAKAVFGAAYVPAIYILCIIVFSMGIILITGGCKKVKALFNSGDSSNAGFSQMHINATMGVDFSILLKMLLLYILPLVLLVFSGIFHSNLLYISLSFLTGFLLLIFIGILKKNISLVSRFFERGLVHFWFLLVLLGVFMLVQKYKVFSILFADHFSETLIINSISVVLILILSFASTRMAVRQFFSKSFYIKKEQWDAYRYVRKNISAEKNILSLNYYDLQLLPVYANCSLYLKGAEWLEPPHAEIKKLIAAFHLLQIKPETVSEWLNGYFEKKKLFIEAPVKKRTKADSLYAYHNLSTLLYYPYFTHFDGVKMDNDDRAAWNPEFLNKIETISNSNATENIKELNNVTDFILLTSENEALRSYPFTNPSGYGLIYNNGLYTIYKKSN